MSKEDLLALTVRNAVLVSVVSVEECSILTGILRDALLPTTQVLQDLKKTKRWKLKRYSRVPPMAIITHPSTTRAHPPIVRGVRVAFLWERTSGVASTNSSRRR
jgi:hypothetical protein